ncbi:MAG: hypothetical protein IT557_00905 [Alphaproteobacteria bacterium]|nr:hypothetical protein [Alphaproteobacteria bacterium]
MSDPERFATLRLARRIWAVAAVHGERGRLARLHDALELKVRRGDRLIYLGNVLGRGPDVAGTIRELLLFRRAVIARPGFEADDVVFLRGAQEEMFHRLLRIQFARGPKAAEEALAWMGQHGIEATLRAYGHSLAEGLRLARMGPTTLGRWTNAIREAVRASPGHDPLLASIKRAALTDAPHGGGVLFVSAGLNPARPFETQGDAFWWEERGFAAVMEGVEDETGARMGWGGFARLVRGYDRAHAGLVEGRFGVSLDAGCGMGGPLLAACFSPDGAILEVVEG